MDETRGRKTQKEGWRAALIEMSTGTAMQLLR